MKEFLKKSVPKILFLSLSFALLPTQLFSANDNQITLNNDSVYMGVEVPAQFPGGISKAYELIKENLQYPDSSLKNKIEGKVIVKFIIRSNGKTDSFTILKGINAELNNEAVRLIEDFPDWIPAQVAGKNVSSYYVFPISFKLDKKSLQTVEKQDTAHIMIPLSTIPIVIDNKLLTEDFDLSYINYEYIDTAYFVEPFPKSKQKELINLYGSSASMGVIKLTTKKFPVFNFEKTGKSTIIYNGRELPVVDNLFSIYPNGIVDFLKMMKLNANYPVFAIFLKLQEVNTINFVLDINGKINEISFHHNGCLMLENSMINTLRQINNWTPFIFNNKKTEVFVSIPFAYIFTSEKDKELRLFKSATPYPFKQPEVFLNTTKFPNELDISIMKFDLSNMNLNNLKSGNFYFNTQLADQWIKTVTYTDTTTTGRIKIYDIVDTMPEFPGGEKEMLKFMFRNIEISEEAHENSKSDRILVSFIVTETGEIDNIIVAKGEYPLLNKAAIDMVKKMPRWIPGKINGEPVAVRYILPVNYIIENK